MTIRTSIGMITRSGRKGASGESGMRCRTSRRILRGWRVLPLTLLALAACTDREPAGLEADPPTIQRGVGTTPGFSDWLTEPTVFNDPLQTTVVCPEDDVGGPCTEITTQHSGIAGGTYAFAGGQEGDVILTAEVQLHSEVTEYADGTFAYEWVVQNLGSGALVSVDCGPNGPVFATSSDDPLLGTAGADRLPDTGDDLDAGETEVQSTESGVALGTVHCGISLNPSTGRVLEMLVPLPDSPTSAEQCKDGGWWDFGFENQGQCVSFVETGKDYRTDG